MSKELRDLVEKLVSDKVDANRRFVDDVLEKIQDRNHQYFLEKFGESLKRARSKKGPATRQRRCATESSPTRTSP